MPVSPFEGFWGLGRPPSTAGPAPKPLHPFSHGLEAGERGHRCLLNVRFNLSPWRMAREYEPP